MKYLVKCTATINQISSKDCKRIYVVTRFSQRITRNFRPGIIILTWSYRTQHSSGAPVFWELIPLDCLSGHLDVIALLGHYPPNKWGLASSQRIFNLIHLQLFVRLQPGWCMTNPRGSQGKTQGELSDIWLWLLTGDVLSLIILHIQLQLSSLGR